MPWIVLALGVLVSLGGVRAGSMGEAALLVVCVVGAWWLTESARTNEFTGGSGGLLLGAVALASYASSQVVRTIAPKAPTWSPPLLPALASVCLAPALLLGRSAVLAQLSGAVCAVCVVAAVLCRRQRFGELGVLVAAAAAPVVPFLALLGALYAYLDPGAAVCLGLSPLAAILGLRREGNWSPSRGAGALLILSAVGIWLAFQGLPEPPAYDY